MKKIKQCASAITVLLTAAAMLWSCAVASERDSRQELIKGLEKKYGESFTLIEDAGGGNLSADHCAVYVRAERFPDERIYVVHGVFDGKTGDRDNFMAYCLRDEAAAYLSAGGRACQHTGRRGPAAHVAGRRGLIAFQHSAAAAVPGGRQVPVGRRLVFHFLPGEGRSVCEARSRLHRLLGAERGGQPQQQGCRCPKNHLCSHCV